MAFLQTVIGHVSSFIGASASDTSSKDKVHEKLAQTKELEKATDDIAQKVVAQTITQAAAPTAAPIPETPKKLTLVISARSKATSTRSHKLALKAFEKVKALGALCEFLDMNDFPRLPYCDGKECFKDENVKKLQKVIAKASSVIFSFPIHNGTCNDVAKSVIDLGGTAWKNKVIGIISTAGGPHSFVHTKDITTSMQAFSNCLIVPKQVYADPKDFPKNTETLSPELDKRLQTLVKETTHLSQFWPLA